MTVDDAPKTRAEILRRVFMNFPTHFLLSLAIVGLSIVYVVALPFSVLLAFVMPPRWTYALGETLGSIMCFAIEIGLMEAEIKEDEA